VIIGRGESMACSLLSNDDVVDDDDDGILLMLMDLLIRGMKSESYSGHNGNNVWCISTQ